MSEKNKQKENKTEKVKVVKIQGREFELTKLSNGKYGGKISFKIGGIENKDVYVDTTSLDLYANDNIRSISFHNSPQKISFKIGDIENKDVDATFLGFNEKNGNICVISFSDNLAQKISFKIGDIDHKVFSNYISLNDNALLNIAISQDIEDYFYHKKKKYKLSFKSGDKIAFDAMGNLQDWCIKNSQTRMQQIEEQDRIYKLEGDVKILKLTHSCINFLDVFYTILFFIVGSMLIVWAVNNIGDVKNVDLKQYFNSEHVNFNKYAFLFLILQRSPCVIAAIIGLKIIQNGLSRMMNVTRVDVVNYYIGLTDDDNTKKDLLKMIAIPFFAPKKVKSSFFDRLIDKTSINIGSERESGGVVSKDKQTPN